MSAASSVSASSAPSGSFGPVKVPQSGPHCVKLPDDGKASYICACGQSAKFPYCDGTHSKVNAETGTKYTPVRMDKEGAKKDTVYICGCGHSGNRPFCDGSHSKLPKEKLPEW